MSIIWDLHEHKEVSFISKPDELLNNMENYVVTGFRPYFHNSIKSKNMADITYFAQNEEKSLFLTPKTDIFPSEMFRTFTAINLMDVFEIQNKRSRN